MQKNDALTELTAAEIANVHGAGLPGLIKIAQAQDVWGNTMSAGEWMDYQVRVANSGGTLDPHDFYGDGFDADKPNIWT